MGFSVGAGEVWGALRSMQLHLQVVEVCQVEDGVSRDFTEDGVLAVKLLRGVQGDEELALIAVLHHSIAASLSSTSQQTSAQHTHLGQTQGLQDGTKRICSLPPFVFQHKPASLCTVQSLTCCMLYWHKLVSRLMR